MKKTIIRIISMLLLLLTFCAIFGFSAQNAEESGGLSNQVTTMFINHFPYTKNLGIDTKQKLIEHIEPIVRKLAHFSIYTAVGICIMAFMCTFSLRLRIKFGTSLIVGLTYAISDEIHQCFVPRQRLINKGCVYRYSRSVFWNSNCLSRGFNLYCIKRKIKEIFYIMGRRLWLE